MRLAFRRCLLMAVEDALGHLTHTVRGGTDGLARGPPKRASIRPCLALMDTGWMDPGPPGAMWLPLIVIIMLAPTGGSLVIMLILIGIKSGECDDDFPA